MASLLKIPPSPFAFNKTYSVEEFLLIEDAAFEKHELRNGKAMEKPEREFTHNIIAANVIAALGDSLEHSNAGSVVLTGDTKIYIPGFENVVYPDVMVLNEPYQLYSGSETVITNPSLVVEIFSPSTETYDRTDKFNDYKQIPSFEEYLLVSQMRPYALASFKSAERTWEDLEAEGLNSTIHLRSVNCTLDLKKIYEGVVFESP